MLPLQTTSFFYRVSFEAKLEGLVAVQAQQTLKEQPSVLARCKVLKGAKEEMLVKALRGGLSRFAEGRRGHELQNGDEQGLYCVDVMVSGLKVVALVDSGATHSFVSERMAWGLHHKVECNGSLFKVVNSGVKLLVRVIRSTSLEVGNCS